MSRVEDASLGQPKPGLFSLDVPWRSPCFDEIRSQSASIPTTVIFVPFGIA